MKQRVRPLLLGASISLSLSLSLLILTIQPVYAWTWLRNNFDTGGTVYCGSSSSLPCILWQEPNYTSISIYAYINPSIHSATWDSAIQLGFDSFNSAPAWNPYMYECFTAGCGPVTYKKATIDCHDYATTETTPYLSPPFQANGYWTAYITGAVVTFGAHVSWNTSYIWTTFSDEVPLCTGLQADIRVVATHETGHVVGLGHTTHSPAAMRTGPHNYYTLQSDDIAGLQYIYPGYLP